ncbi:hypothetical protein LCGC14_2578520 [marine sediment metagenome]|uniref:Methyltransferase domain-containing protein n=1 Tax=marine sediment metagenome TaxID=412755 RepID=A0A0F9D7S5_9ZZZZ
MITPKKTNIGFDNETPFEVAKAIREFTENKVLCDVGCKAGRFMQACIPYAKEVKGIELSEFQAELGQNLDLNISVGDIKETTLPTADVYYCWLGFVQALRFMERIETENIKGVFIFGDYSGMDFFFDLLEAEKRTIKTHRGDFEIHILRKK